MAQCYVGSAALRLSKRTPPSPSVLLCRLIDLYNAAMPKRQIGIEVLIEDHFWNDTHSRYVYSFHCPACAQLRMTPELGIYRCDCGSWLIVTNQR